MATPERIGTAERRYVELSPCKNEDKGCKWNSLLGHLDKHIKHECRYEESLTCEFCREKMDTDQIDAHQNLHPKDEANWRKGCENARLKCIYCEDTIERQHLDEHLNKDPSETNWLDGCQNVSIECIVDSCEETLERYLLKEHYDSHHSPSEEIDYDPKTEESKFKQKAKERRLGDCFEKKHLGLVVTIAWEARKKWHAVGEELGANVDASTSDKLTDEACFARVINAWLTSNKDKSGQTLIDALKSSRVDGNDTAKFVEKCKLYNL